MFTEHTLVRSLGIFLVGSGLIFQFVFAPKYIDYSTNRKLDAIDQKLNLIFLEMTATTSLRESNIRSFASLGSEESKKRELVINTIARYIGIFYVLLGAFTIVVGERVVRNP